MSEIQQHAEDLIAADERGALELADTILYRLGGREVEYQGSVFPGDHMRAVTARYAFVPRKQPKRRKVAR